MRDAQKVTDAARSLDANLACFVWRTLERLHVCDGAFAPPLFSARPVREAECAQVRRCGAVVGMLSALAVPARICGHPVCCRCLPLLPVRVPARCVLVPLAFEDTARAPVSAFHSADQSSRGSHGGAMDDETYVFPHALCAVALNPQTLILNDVIASLDCISLHFSSPRLASPASASPNQPMRK
jgi:hypothetical protein